MLVDRTSGCVLLWIKCYASSIIMNTWPAAVIILIQLDWVGHRRYDRTRGNSYQVVTTYARAISLLMLRIIRSCVPTLAPHDATNARESPPPGAHRRRRPIEHRKALPKRLWRRGQGRSGSRSGRYLGVGGASRGKRWGWGWSCITH